MKKKITKQKIMMHTYQAISKNRSFDFWRCTPFFPLFGPFEAHRYHSQRNRSRSIQICRIGFEVFVFWYIRQHQIWVDMGDEPNMLKLAHSVWDSWYGHWDASCWELVLWCEGAGDWETVLGLLWWLFQGDRRASSCVPYCSTFYAYLKTP